MSRSLSQTLMACFSFLCLGMAACSTTTGTLANSFNPDSKPPSRNQPPPGPTVTLASLTSNNTAACPSSGALPAWCQTAFTGQIDSRTGVVTQVYDPPAGNVSTDDIHGYLTNGAQTRIFANFMLGFCINTGSPYCNSNVQTGYASNNAATVAAQAADLAARHFNGAVMSWEGAGTTEDSASLLFQSWADQHACSSAGCKLTYVLMFDGPSVNYNVQATGIPGTTGASCTGLTGGSYEDCIIAHIRNDMCWMNGKHWGNAAYEKLNGRPVVQIFPDEGVIPATGPAPSWADAWYYIQQWNSNLPQNCGAAPYNANNGVPLIVFENAGGFTHQDSAGSYYWIEPAGISLTTDQFNYNIGPQGADATLDTFLADSLAYTSGLVWTNGFKGFNSIQSTWGTGRIMDQQCGQTWMQSLTESNSFYSGGVPYMEVATWNDYNEGTEIESGIDNCYTVSAGVSRSSLNWQLKASSANASISTVARVEIYDSLDGTNLTLLTSQAAAASGTYNLNNLASGTHKLFVRMIGKNSIINRISSAVPYTN